MAASRKREIVFVFFSCRASDANAKLCVGVSETVLLSLALLGESRVRAVRRQVRFCLTVGRGVFRDFAQRITARERLFDVKTKGFIQFIFFSLASEGFKASP